MIPSAAQWSYIGMMRSIIASRNGLAWIQPSYICAEVTIESGWDPNIPSPTSTSLGLMQVVVGTVAEVANAYNVTIGDQTDPYQSLLAGILYFDRCARKIIADRGSRSLYLSEVAEAYNQGWGGFLQGLRNERYGMKMLAAQLKWDFIDTAAEPTIMMPYT